MAKLALVYKDFSYWTGSSAVGLNVAVHLTARVLSESGIDVSVHGVKDNIELFYLLRDNPDIDRVVIAAPWLSPLDLSALSEYFLDVTFTVQSHCNVGGLIGDARGIGNFRGYIDLSLSRDNVHVAGNSKAFAEWLSDTYHTQAYFLPNLYPLGELIRKKPNADKIKIGAFGAMRSQKNFITAAAAALVMQERLQLPVEFFISTGGETESRRFDDVINQMTEGIPGFTLIRKNWSSWQDFRRLVSKMDLLLQPSYTESFNIVTADGIAEGVPVVVSHAIDWAPFSWKADSDDALDIAEKGLKLLDSNVFLGYTALQHYNFVGKKLWREFLNLE